MVLESEQAERFRAGDVEAFAAIYQRYTRGIHAFCLRLLGEQNILAWKMQAAASSMIVPGEPHR